MSDERDKERRKKFIKARFPVMIKRTLQPALKHCAYCEGRSVSNFVQNVLWAYMQEKHGVKVDSGVVHYMKQYREVPPTEERNEVEKQIEDMLKE